MGKTALAFGARLVVAVLVAVVLGGCSQHIAQADRPLPPTTPEEALSLLAEGNALYVVGEPTWGDTSPQRRERTDENGQAPYAVVLTCSDSRVPPEHIFSAGVGDLFVVRTAGNVVDEMALGSIEYGVAHANAMVVLVLGHTGCGAVAAAIDGHAEGHIEAVVDEVQAGIGAERDPAAAERANIAHATARVLQSDILAEKIAAGELIVAEALYDIATGEVEILT